MKKGLKLMALSSLLVSCLASAAVIKPPLAGYWQNFTNPAETPVKLTDIPSSYDIINIAFGDLQADGTVTFTLQGPPYANMQNATEIFKSDIKTLQAKGKKVVLSLGGQNAYFQINNASQENNFVNSLQQIIKDYGFDGIDYDFESGLSTGNNTYLVDATQKLKQSLASQNKSIMFTLAPETIDVYWQVFPYGKYDALIKSGLIDVVQVQLYNSGCMPGSKAGSSCYSQGSEDFIVSQADSTIQVWKKNGIQNAEKMYALGLPATQNAAGGGYVNAATLQKAWTCLKTSTQCDTYSPTENYAQIGGVMTWSINWDAKNNYAFSQSVQNLK